MDELLAEFIAETREMMEACASELVAWEADPQRADRLDAIFRFVHTVKGNCGFFDLPDLERLSHGAEDALSKVRAGARQPDATLVSAILAVIDRIMEIVDALEAQRPVPAGNDEDLIRALAANSPARAPGSDEASDEASDETGDQLSGMPLSHPPRKAENERGNEGARASSPPPPSRSIRVPVALLDQLMNGISDMVLARNELSHRMRQAGAQPTVDGPFERLSSILGEVREAVTRMRMQRVGLLYAPLPRLVRDLARELGKQVNLRLEGGEVELDREMIELVRDPLIHILRNAIDHGIEPGEERLRLGKREEGLLKVEAHQSGNKVAITVSDDGRGLDSQAIARKAVAGGLISEEEAADLTPDQCSQFIFAPGLSTARSITAISGRGVGLDVVRANLDRLCGSIRVESTPGKGTRFHLEIPLTLTIIAALSIEAGGHRFALSQSHVEEIVQLHRLETPPFAAGEGTVLAYRGEQLACLSLAGLLGLADQGQAHGPQVPAQARRRGAVLVLRPAGGQRFALLVDRILDNHELVIKPLAPVLATARLYAGTTLLDDGSPILLLDIPAIAQRARLAGRAAAAQAVAKDAPFAEVVPPARDDVQLILFTGLEGEPFALRMAQVERVETLARDTISQHGQEWRAVVEGRILPLVLLDGDIPGQVSDGHLRALRIADGEIELLIAARSIDDMCRCALDLEPAGGLPFVEGLVLIEGRAVRLLDVHALFCAHAHLAAPRRQASCRIPRDEWSRTILAPLVEAAGYRLLEDEQEAADVEILIDGADLPAQGKAKAARVIALRSQPASEEEAERGNAIYRYDREAILQALRAGHAARGT